MYRKTRLTKAENPIFILASAGLEDGYKGCYIAYNPRSCANFVLETFSSKCCNLLGDSMFSKTCLTQKAGNPIFILATSCEEDWLKGF